GVEGTTAWGAGGACLARGVARCRDGAVGVLLPVPGGGGVVRQLSSGVVLHLDLGGVECAGGGARGDSGCGRGGGADLLDGPGLPVGCREAVDPVGCRGGAGSGVVVGFALGHFVGLGGGSVRRGVGGCGQRGLHGLGDCAVFCCGGV